VGAFLKHVGAARSDYMVDDHDPLDAAQAVAAADALMAQITKGGSES
jgi:hypothetical protein